MNYSSRSHVDTRNSNVIFTVLAKIQQTYDDVKHQHALVTSKLDTFSGVFLKQHKNTSKCSWCSLHISSRISNQGVGIYHASYLKAVWDRNIKSSKTKAWFLQEQFSQLLKSMLQNGPDKNRSDKKHIVRCMVWQCTYMCSDLVKLIVSWLAYLEQSDSCLYKFSHKCDEKKWRPQISDMTVESTWSEMVYFRTKLMQNIGKLCIYHFLIK